jgi:hypothetical protein
VDLLSDAISEGGDKLIPVERRILHDQLPMAGVIAKRQQTLDHGVTFGPLDGFDAHLEPHVL